MIPRCEHDRHRQPRDSPSRPISTPSVFPARPEHGAAQPATPYAARGRRRAGPPHLESAPPPPPSETTPAAAEGEPSAAASNTKPPAAINAGSSGRATIKRSDSLTAHHVRNATMTTTCTTGRTHRHRGGRSAPRTAPRRYARPAQCAPARRRCGTSEQRRSVACRPGDQGEIKRIEDPDRRHAPSQRPYPPLLLDAQAPQHPRRQHHQPHLDTGSSRPHDHTGPLLSRNHIIDTNSPPATNAMSNSGTNR